MNDNARFTHTTYMVFLRIIQHRLLAAAEYALKEKGFALNPEALKVLITVVSRANGHVVDAAVHSGATLHRQTGIDVALIESIAPIHVLLARRLVGIYRDKYGSAEKEAPLLPDPVGKINWSVWKLPERREGNGLEERIQRFLLDNLELIEKLRIRSQEETLSLKHLDFYPAEFIYEEFKDMVD